MNAEGEIKDDNKNFIIDNNNNNNNKNINNKEDLQLKAKENLLKTNKEN